MPKYPLAAVGVLALITGGVAGYLFHRPTGESSAVRAAAAQGAGLDPAPEAGSGAAFKTADVARGPEGSATDDGDDPARPPADSGTDARKVGAEESDAPRKRAEVRNAGTGGRREMAGRASRRPATSRAFVRTSGAGGTSGGGGVAGRAVGGVKKTGRIIGRTFGKIGGVFHD